jgi:hypothetical protein
MIELFFDNNLNHMKEQEIFNQKVCDLQKDEHTFKSEKSENSFKNVSIETKNC